MSLLQNEDFLIWQIRTSYLANNKDGVGERLIHIEPPSLFNDPAVRSAWGAAPTVYRTYSPPIPTATAVASEYFKAPHRSADQGESALTEDDEDGGLATGHAGADAVGLGLQTRRRQRRRQRERHRDEEDSSDLSDESDELDETAQRAAQQIKFTKMPVRTRAGSSPARSFKDRESSELLDPFTKRPSIDEQARRGSEGTVEMVKQRARRDTTTSSDLSSENDPDPTAPPRRMMRRRKPGRQVNFLTDHTEEEDEDEDEERSPAKPDTAPPMTPDPGSAGSSLSSGFDAGVDSGSLLGGGVDGMDSNSLSHLVPPALRVPTPASPRRPRQQTLNGLPVLPPPRPISTIIPGSALGQAIRAQKAKPKNPQEVFARFSGQGALNPLNIRIYCPFSSAPNKPFDMPLQRTVQDGDSGVPMPVSVADAIGLALWRYYEEQLDPPIPRNKVDVNRWTLRIVDDGEVEYDFPPLNRISNMIDFASNNNRPARSRARGKPYDEFALVEATETQFVDNQRLTPKYTKIFHEFDQDAGSAIVTGNRSNAATPSSEDAPNDVFGATVPKPFAFANRKGSATLDRPAMANTYSTPRIGPPKKLTIHFTTLEAQTHRTLIEVTTDTYIAEVLDAVCKRWGLDKAHHFLRVTGTMTVAPSDRTVEAIGSLTELDLVRRRFAHAGGLSGLGSSPSNSSPHAPLVLQSSGLGSGMMGTGITTPQGTSTPIATSASSSSAATALRRGRRHQAAAGGGSGTHPLAQQQDVAGVLAQLTNGWPKRYVVLRKQPMSFASSHPRVLLLDGEYLHILPVESGAGGPDVLGGLGDSGLTHGGGVGGAGAGTGAAAAAGAGGAAGKTTTVPYSMIVGCKVSRRHPKTFRVVIFRDRETKRYDFESPSGPEEAAEIVAEITKGMQPFASASGWQAM